MSTESETADKVDSSAPASTAPAPPPSAFPGSVDGGIASLPPVAVVDTVRGYPISRRTGEPVRPMWLAVAVAMFLIGSVVSAVALVKVLWDAATVSGFHDSARLLQWIKPEIVSFLTVVLVLSIGIIGVLTVGAPAVAAYNAWNGERRTRWLGIAAVGVSLLAIVMNPIALVAIGPVAIGAGLLWLPEIRAYVDTWSALRVPAGTPVTQWATDVIYGPVSRYKN